MADDQDLQTTIQQTANGPRRVQTDAGSAESHSLTDLIAADRYRRSTAAAKKGLGFRHVKLRPPGAADVDFTDNGSTNCSG